MTSTSFEPSQQSDVACLVDEHPLAWLVSAAPRFRSTMAPLLAERDADGGVAALFGHIARRNPHHAILQAHPDVQVLVQGPQGYVLPAIVPRPDWAPTWNFAVVRFEGRIEFVPDEDDASLVRLAAHLERGSDTPWTVDRMGERYAGLKAQIAAFRIHVDAVHARFKLGQDEAPATFDAIVDALDNPPLVDWMRRTADGDACRR